MTREPTTAAHRGTHDALTPAQLEARICAAVRRVADFPPAHEIPREQPLAELGFDSIMLIELLADLEPDLGRASPDTAHSVASLCGALMPNATSE